MIIEQIDTLVLMVTQLSTKLPGMDKKRLAKARLTDIPSDIYFRDEDDD